MRRVIITTFLAVVVFAVFLYFRLGMNKPVELSAKEQGPFATLYLEHTGPYYKIAEKIDTVEAWAKANSVSCAKTFGEYIDDPKTVAEDRLQSRGGCIIDKLPEGVTQQEDMKLGEIPKRDYLSAVFRGAPSVGPYTVYPKAFDWMKENSRTLDGPVVELYTVLNEKEVLTEYLFPIK